jgi:hypothetical protein
MRCRIRIPTLNHLSRSCRTHYQIDGCDILLFIKHETQQCKKHPHRHKKKQAPQTAIKTPLQPQSAAAPTTPPDTAAAPKPAIHSGSYIFVFKNRVSVAPVGQLGRCHASTPPCQVLFVLAPPVQVCYCPSSRPCCRIRPCSNLSGPQNAQQAPLS